MRRHLMADRTKQEARESTTAARPDDDHLGTLRLVQECGCRVALA
jgi:hypothetical protein